MQIINNMGFWKAFFGGETDPEEEKKNAEDKKFDMLKYDGVKAIRYGQNELAAKFFNEALKYKNDPEVHDYLSNVYIRMGMLDEALQETKIVVQAEPDNINLLLKAASVAYMKEDYAEMTDFCKQALELDGDHALVHLIYAKAELGQQNLIQSIARLTKALALDDELAEGHQLRGQTLMLMGDLDAATDDAEWLEQNQPTDPDAMLLVARLEAAKGHQQEAVDKYGKVIDLNPFHLDAYRERGKIRFDLGDKQGAEEDMQKVLELNPNEMADVNGEYSAEGIEQKTRQAYSNLNPFGI